MHFDLTASHLFHSFDFLDLRFVLGDQFLDVRFQTFDAVFLDFLRLLSHPFLSAYLLGRFSYLLLFLDFHTMPVTKVEKLERFLDFDTMVVVMKRE